MIDTESEPGAWEREMAQGPKCEWCIHYRYGSVRWIQGENSIFEEMAWCERERPLVPCSRYEREPGADG